MYRMIDLFSGAGGMTCGFKRAGFSPVIAVEHIPAFAQTYMANFRERVLTLPIEDAVSTISSIKADVVIGGPPCQGFSNLTGNKSEDSRRSLWRYFIDVVRTSDCKAFVIENVPNLLTSCEGRQIVSAAESLGYYVTAKVLLASRFGVPQNRRRVFIIGSKSGPIELPDGNGAVVTVREALSGIPLIPGAIDLSTFRPLRTSDLHVGRKPTPVSLKRYSLIPPGGNRFDLQRLAPEITPACWVKKTSGGTDIFGRLSWDEPARCTIRTEFYKPEKGRFLHPDQDRPITHWEAARLQTFPDDFMWYGSRIQIAAQIGNAVPPVLAEAVARSVMNGLECG